MKEKQLRWISGLLSVLLVFFLALPAFAEDDALQEETPVLLFAEPTTEPAEEPTDEPATEPVTEPVTAPVTEPTTEPTTAPVTEPTTEPTTAPVHTHRFGSWKLTRKATDKKNGQFTRTCAGCGEVQTRRIARVGSVKLFTNEKHYSGKALTTTVTVKDKDGKVLRSGKDYKLQWKNNVNVGLAEVKVSGAGNYKFSLSRFMRIVPRNTGFSKAVASVNTLILRWKPVKKQADGYQIQYGTDKKFGKGTKTVKVTGAASVYTALSGLKQKTTYSVRMRTFRKVGQRTFYSVWSKVRTLKTMVAAAHTIDGQLPAGKRVPVSYFDDVVFVGDSITEGLRYYAMASGALGNAKFLSAVSLSATNALWNVSDRSKHPRWNGQKMKLEQSVPLTGAKKVYVMLGMNDITSVGVDRSVTNIETVCSNILKAAPDVQIYIESITPRANVQADDIGVLNNTSITRCNEKLAALCLKRGWYFVNVAEAMFDGNGYFKSEYCSDRSSMGMHFTYPGCAAWVDYLYTHTV